MPSVNNIKLLLKLLKVFHCKDKHTNKSFHKYFKTCKYKHIAELCTVVKRESLSIGVPGVLCLRERYFTTVPPGESFFFFA